jgi:hypothetical protein
MAKMPSPRDRRRWRQRLLDQDGPSVDEEGGIEAWLRLVEATGASRAEAWSGARLLPGVRFAVDAYLHFVRDRSWIEGVASSLTELFSPSLMTVRIAAFEEHYPWVAAEGLTYFRSRPRRATDDATHATELVLAHCTTAELQAPRRRGPRLQVRPALGPARRHLRPLRRPMSAPRFVPWVRPRWDESPRTRRARRARRGRGAVRHGLGGCAPLRRSARRRQPP